MGPTAAGRRPHPLLSLSSSSTAAAAAVFALESVPDDGADAAAGDGAAEAGAATGAEGARQRGAVEAEELVAVGGAPGVLSGAAECTRLHRVAAVLEPLDRTLRVVDL